MSIDGCPVFSRHVFKPSSYAVLAVVDALENYARNEEQYEPLLKYTLPANQVNTHHTHGSVEYLFPIQLFLEETRVVAG